MVATKLVDLLKTARPRQWLKNLTLYAALVFTGNIYTYQVWIRDFLTVTEAVVVFTVIAAAIYFLNDVVDIKADQAHPFKKWRPVASGRLSKTSALVVFGVGTILGWVWSYHLSGLFLQRCWVIGYYKFCIRYGLKISRWWMYLLWH